MKQNISIKRDKFLHKSNIALLIFFCLFIVLALWMAFEDLKTGGIALATSGILTVILRKYALSINFSLLILIFLVMASLLSYFCHINIIIYTLIIIFFSPIYFVKEVFESLKEDQASEIFYMDNQQIRCLSMHSHSSKYRSYALNPMEYLRTIKITDVISIVFKKKYMSIATQDEVVTPLELTTQELEMIQNFVAVKFPHLQNEHIPQKSQKLEKQTLILNYLLGCWFLILFGIIYYIERFIGDQKLILFFIGIMFLVPMFIMKFISKKR